MNSPKSLHVLVVDDNADSAEALAEAIEFFGHSAETAGDGPSALSSASARPPDLVFIDIGLPGMDGYELCRRLQGHFPDRPPVMFALTGYEREEDVQESLRSGFRQHLVKPLGLDRLRELLAEHSGA